MLRCKGKILATTIPLRSSLEGCRRHEHGKVGPVNDSEDAGKYRVENQQSVQGQVIGERNIIHQYFSPVGGSVPATPPVHAWNIPFSPNPFFTGREEILTQIRDHFQTGHAAILS